MILLSLLLTATSFAADRFSGVTCPSGKELAQEMLDSELSGQRFLNANPECRQSKNFPHFRSASYSYGERPTQQVWYQADEKIPYEIKQITENKDRTVQVDFDWHVLDKKNPKNTKIISDSIKYSIYSGKTKDVVGCTGVLFAPANIVVKKSCINSAKSKK